MEMKEKHPERASDDESNRAEVTGIIYRQHLIQTQH
jgi:hypothetical protein